MVYSIIAERELVVAFSLIGVRGFIASSKEEALVHFNTLTRKASQDAIPLELRELKVLIISEQVGEFLQKEVNAWQLGGDFPLIVEIPCLEGAMHGKKSLQDAIREAVGVHV